VESLRVIGLQAQVSVESHKIKHFAFVFQLTCCPVSYKVVENSLFQLSIHFSPPLSVYSILEDTNTTEKSKLLRCL